LDFCQVIAGGYSTTIMADLGAEVVKVEPPGTGDTMRLVGPRIKGESSFFLHKSRNKKSICIDLKKQEGIELIKKLIPHFDAVTENFTPGVMKKLGLGYDEVREIKEDIIYLSVSGYGQNNDYSDRLAYDIMVQAETGLTSLNGLPEQGRPLRSPLSVADYAAATYGALGLASALYHHDRTGKGQYIDVAMYDSLISFMDNTFLICDAFRDDIEKGADQEQLGLLNTGNRHPDAAPHGIYKTLDGYIAHTQLSNAMWHALLKIIGKKELISDQSYNTLKGRIKHWKKIDMMIEQWTKEHTSDEVVKIFKENKLPVGKIRTVYETFNNAHNEKRGVFTEIEHPVSGKRKVTSIPVKFSETPARVNDPSPSLGEHNYDVFSDILGYTKEQIDKLVEKGILHNK